MCDSVLACVLYCRVDIYLPNYLQSLIRRSEVSCVDVTYTLGLFPAVGLIKCLCFCTERRAVTFRGTAGSKMYNIYQHALMLGVAEDAKLTLNKVRGLF